MDHVLPFPDGPSTPDNTGALSTRCHQLKTRGLLHLENSQADGSATLITYLGQRIHLPPQPYQGFGTHAVTTHHGDPPTDDAPPDEPADPSPHDDDPPPF